MFRFFHTVMEVVGWLQIALSPSLLGLFIATVVYFSNPSTTTLIVSLVIFISGIILGVYFATKIWKTKGTVWFMSRIMATPELDGKKCDSEVDIEGKSDLASKNKPDQDP